MKNIKINHEFTLKEILLSIQDKCTYNGDFKKSRDDMVDKINDFLRMIK